MEPAFGIKRAATPIVLNIFSIRSINATFSLLFKYIYALQVSSSNQQEIAIRITQQAAIKTLRTNHLKSFQERKAKWKAEHPAKEFYQRTEDDNRRDCTLDEWFWEFFQRIHVSTSPEVRYRLERDPDHGFGHKPFPSGIHERYSNKCVPECRFYESTGRLTVFDILRDYRSYQQFEDVWQAYKELEKEGSLPTE